MSESEIVIITGDNQVVIQEEHREVVVSTGGLQGPPGPQGPAGTAGGSAIIHVQSVPSNVWIVNHLFGREPTVVVVIGNELVIADITYPTTNTAVISFGSPQTGKAILT